MEFLSNFVSTFGRKVGAFVSVLFQSGRETVDLLITTLIPFMIFVSFLVGLITSSGIGNIIAKSLVPLATSLPGLLLLVLICTIPILSPLLGPGAVIAQIIGVLIGTEIGLGHIPPQYALPAIYAINGQVGCDFVPVALGMMDAEPETVEYGVPAYLISRWVTGPIAVIIAYFSSIGMY